LRIEQGRDSLPGRITTIEVGTLSLREIAALRGFGAAECVFPRDGLEALASKQLWLDLRAAGFRCRDIRDGAFVAFSERGGYPGEVAA
jgi:hypothetical protein